MDIPKPCKELSNIKINMEKIATRALSLRISDGTAKSYCTGDSSTIPDGRNLFIPSCLWDSGFL